VSNGHPDYLEATVTNPTPPPESEVSEELRKLGENLKQAAHSAWHSEESQKLRQEIRTGLRALEIGLKEAADDLTTGETGQRIKADVHEFKEKVRSGEVESKLRQELLAALRHVNSTLEKNTHGTPPDHMV
jgi:hypothetical protein